MNEIAKALVEMVKVGGPMALHGVLLYQALECVKLTIIFGGLVSIFYVIVKGMFKDDK